MEHKKMVTGDFMDMDTGLRFVEDIRGNYHLVHMMGDMPAPVVNVEPPIVNIPAPVVNVETDGGTTNNYNTTNNYYGNDEYESAQRIILQNRLTGFTWPSNTVYNRINASAGGYINYTVPFGKEFHINLIIAGQYSKGDGNNGISYIGIFIDGNLLLQLPLILEMVYEFESPIKISATTFVEFKFLPYAKKTDLGITIIGHTV